MLKAAAVVCMGLRDTLWVSAGTRHEALFSRTVLGELTVEGDSPVGERERVVVDVIPSRPEHVEFRLNQGGPPSKAKYYW